MSDIDWFAVYREMLDTDVPATRLSPADVEALIEEIVAGRIVAPAVRPPKPSRKRWVAGGTALAVLAGGATAAALWNRTKPESPHQGIACHASAQVVGDAQVIPPATDPLRACAQLWLAGLLPDIVNGGPVSDVAPPQFACVGPGGGLDIFPNLADPPMTCSALGLSDADTNVVRDPLVLLQERLTSEINLVCVDAETGDRLAKAALADAGLDDWTVTTREGTTGCVFAGEDPDAKSVYLISNPSQTNTT